VCVDSGNIHTGPSGGVFTYLSQRDFLSAREDLSLRKRRIINPIPPLVSLSSKVALSTYQLAAKLAFSLYADSQKGVYNTLNLVVENWLVGCSLSNLTLCFSQPSRMSVNLG